jgi:hypothetical protein
MNDMVDMSRFVEAKSDQLNADDLIGITRTITVTRVTGSDGDQPVSIFYQGDGGKPFKPCKTMRRVLMAIWGKYANEYVGRSMTLYRDDSVTFGGLATGGIRISHMSHMDKETTVVVMKTKGKKAGIKIVPLQDAPQAQPAALTLEQARAKLNAATDLEELATTWRNKAMAPHREALASLLAELKLSLAPDPSPNPNEGAGEAHAIDADFIIEHIGKKARVSDVNALVESHMDAILSMPEEDKDRIVAAQLARVGEIKGAAE